MVYQYLHEKEMVATHIPLLTRVFDLSEGDVLEVGTGYFSTLLLHWLATMTRRQVYSYDNQEYWYNRSRKLESEYHHVVLVKGGWENADFDQRYWGMVFIDHSPGWRRHIDIARLANKADYIVIHDTDPERDRKYKLSQIWGLFKYRYDYTRMFPYTSVVSNVKDLTGIA